VAQRYRRNSRKSRSNGKKALTAVCPPVCTSTSTDTAVQTIGASMGTYTTLNSSHAQMSAYGAAGVDIDSGNRAVELMKAAVQSTYGPEVIAGIGAFGGQFDAQRICRARHPVLVASTDGVGTKTELALRFGEEGLLVGLGVDMVNHSINDILVQAARPLFFMDYIAAQKLDPTKVAKIVEGMANACKEAGCALLGGETAEMPGTYFEGQMDIAGTIVGLAERDELLPRPDMSSGDIMLGLWSSGLHTNGYSLARSVTKSMNLEEVLPELGESLKDALLRPHRSYLGILENMLALKPPLIKGLAHITGGGLLENIPRVLAPGLDARIDTKSWQWPPIFSFCNAEGISQRRKCTACSILVLAW